MTRDTHPSMITHKVGEYWFSEELKFQCLRNTSAIAVKLSEWIRDVGVVAEMKYWYTQLWRTSYTKKKLTSPVRRMTMMSMRIYPRTQKTSWKLILRERATSRHRTIPVRALHEYARAGEDRGSKDNGTGSDDDGEGSERLGNNEWLITFYS